MKASGFQLLIGKTIESVEDIYVEGNLLDSVAIDCTDGTAYLAFTRHPDQIDDEEDEQVIEIVQVQN